MTGTWYFWGDPFCTVNGRVYIHIYQDIHIPPFLPTYRAELLLFSLQRQAARFQKMDAIERWRQLPRSGVGEGGLPAPAAGYRQLNQPHRAKP